MTHDITQKLEKLETSLQTIQQVVNSSSSNQSLYSYFDYSIIISEHDDEAPLIIGNFQVKNASTHTLKDPTVLLKITADSACDFSGKFKTDNETNQAYNFLWERVMTEEVDPQTHFCFQPTQKDTLQPNEQLAFQHFQIKVPSNESITVEGFTYVNQQNDGVPALNMIQLSM